jgi:hypothetical protein
MALCNVHVTISGIGHDVCRVRQAELRMPPALRASPSNAPVPLQEVKRDDDPDPTNGRAEPRHGDTLAPDGRRDGSSDVRRRHAGQQEPDRQRSDVQRVEVPRPRD